MKKITVGWILDKILWGIPIFLAPYTLLVLVSQTAVPGDITYPFKRGMEDVVLFAASFNPTARTLFHSDLIKRRYDEAEKLLLQHQADTASLDTFIDELKATQDSIVAIPDYSEKAAFEQNLINSIDTYQGKLSQVQTQIQARQSSNSQFPTSVPIAVVQHESILPPSPTPVPQSNSVLLDIDLAQQELERLKQQIEETQRQMQEQSVATPTPAISSTVTPTSLPTSTPTLTPTLTPTPTLLPRESNPHGPAFNASTADTPTPTITTSKKSLKQNKSGGDDD